MIEFNKHNSIFILRESYFDEDAWLNLNLIDKVDGYSLYEDNSEYWVLNNLSLDYWKIQKLNSFSEIQYIVYDENNKAFNFYDTSNDNENRTNSIESFDTSYHY